MIEAKDCRETSTSVFFQLVNIALSASIVIGLLWYETRGFRSFDSDPQLLPITPEKARAFGGSPAFVTVGLTINNFSVFDTLTNDFAFAGTVWFEFDPSMVSLDTVKKMVFEKGEIVSLSEPITKIIGRKLFVAYDIRIKKKDNLSHVFFPISGYKIHVVIDNAATPSELVFTSSVDNFKIGAAPISAWIPYAKRVETGYSVSEVKAGDAVRAISHPRVVFTIDFALNGIRHLVTILLPLILVFYISVFTFSMNPITDLRTIISLSSASVTGLLAYRFVIENLSPKVGYFMVSDYLFFTFLGTTCIVFLVNSLSRELCGRTKKYITVLLHMTVLALIFYILHVR